MATRKSPLVSDAIASIEAAADKIGLPELAKRADVPYTTLAEWRAKGWRPRTVESFERLLRAASAATGVAP